MENHTILKVSLSFAQFHRIVVHHFALFDLHIMISQITKVRKYRIKAEVTDETWGFPKIVVPQYGWFTMETPIKMDDLGVPPFKETPTCYLGYFGT